MSRTCSRILLLLSFLGAAGLRATPDEAAGVDRGPVVQLTTRDSAVLVWRSIGAITPVVRFGSTPGNLDRIAPAEATLLRVSEDVIALPELPRLHSAPPETHQYETRIEGLAEDTKYYYGIFDGETLLAGCDEDYFFRTQPDPSSERPLRLWVVGDSGDGSAAQVAVFESMRSFVGNDGRPVDAFLHLGDMAYDSGLDAEFQANFFDIYAPLLRNTVTWPTMGNHEGYNSDGVLGVGPYYDAYVLPRNGEAGGVPSGSESFYSFDLGPIHFVCLNSHDGDRAEGGAMAAWLEEDLARNESSWLIAFWHHPPYSKGSHHSDAEERLIEMRQVMMPILESHGVDLVLTGHSHVYERSMLIDGAYATPTTAAGVVLDDGDGDPAGDGPYLKSAHLHPHEGTVAVVSGHGRGSGPTQGRSPLHRVTIQEAGSVLLDLEGEVLTARMLNDAGEVRDHFQIIKRDEIEPREPLSDPWHPLGPAIIGVQIPPDHTQLHLVPRPRTEDATTYYTLDGSTPTEASTVYEGPVELPAATLVSAVTIWRGGARRSPVATKIVGPVGAQFPNFVRIPVLLPEDDARESDLGLVDLHSPTIGLAEEAGVVHMGLRFRDVPVPPRATIFEARIVLTTGKIDLEQAGWIINADMSDPPAPFSTAIGNLRNRPRSLTPIQWAVPQWQWPDRQVVTPNLWQLVEQLIHQPGWASGESMSFLVDGAGSRTAYSFDGDPGWAPELQLSYDPRDPLSLAADVNPLMEIAEGPGGARRVFLSFHVLDTATARGLRYAIEGSATLEPGSWQFLNASLAANLPTARFGFSHLRFFLTRPDGQEWPEHYYIRVRVMEQ